MSSPAKFIKARRADAPYAPYGWNMRHKRPMRLMGGMCAISALCALWVECAP